MTRKSPRPVLLVWGLAFVLFTGLGATWSLASPVLSHPDEPAHSVKAAALYRGEFVPPKLPIPDEGPGHFHRGGFTTVVDVPYAYSWQTSLIPPCYIHDARQPAGCAPAFVADDRPATWTTFIGRYPPTYYAPLGWVTRVDTGASGFYAMRLISAALNGALLATALVAAASLRRGRLMAVGVLVACTPQVMLLAGAVNPNGFEVAAAVCAWTSLAALLLHEGERLPRPLLAAAGISCSLLAMTRPLTTLWLALIGLTLLAALGRWQSIRERLRERGALVMVVNVGIASAAGASWMLLTDGLGNQVGYDPRGLGLADAVRHSLELTPSYLGQMVAAFGWIRVLGPRPLLWGWGLLVVALVAVAVLRGDRRVARTTVALLVLSLLLPTVLQVPIARNVGFVWSGRYGLAVSTGVPILAALAAGLPGRLADGAVRRLVGLLVVLAAAGHVAAHAASMRRYVVGVDGPLNYLNESGWDPPTTPVVLLVLVALFAAGLAALTYRVVTHGVGR